MEFTLRELARANVRCHSGGLGTWEDENREKGMAQHGQGVREGLPEEVDFECQPKRPVELAEWRREQKNQRPSDRKWQDMLS